MKFYERLKWFLGTAEGKRASSVNDTYTTLFSNELGQKLLVDLLAESGMLSGLKPTNPNEIMINEGKRQMMVHIMDRANLPIEKFAQLHKSFYTRSID